MALARAGGIDRAALARADGGGGSAHEGAHGLAVMVAQLVAHIGAVAVVAAITGRTGWHGLAVVVAQLVVAVVAHEGRTWWRWWR